MLRLLLELRTFLLLIQEKGDVQPFPKFYSSSEDMCFLMTQPNPEHLLIWAACKPWAHTFNVTAVTGITCSAVPNNSLEICTARYNTWLLIKLTPKGVVFSFLFFGDLPLADLPFQGQAGQECNMPTE